MIDVLTSVALAVDPVPWARSQMAFTLAFHIILVPLGVSWSVMTLIANYRGIKHDDADAMLLAQRWSKYMAVTFAVGAVTGTVLSFEFGLLWPKFMGQWGAAFGVPFAFEGIFFFTEAVFISIYIFGWRRLKPWTHFWTGVPIAVAGIFGSISVVAANAWMNSPAGRHPRLRPARSTDVDPMGVIFNDAMPLMAAHMVVAAYLVGGFMVASVYAVGMLRGRTDRYHRIGFIIAFTVAAIATPVQMGVGDGLARWVYDNQPTKFAAIEMVPKTSSDVPEVLLGHLNSEGEVVGGIPIPGLASILSDPGTGTSTVDPGPRRDARRRAPDQPRGQRRPPGLGRDGRPGHAAVPADPVVVGGLDLPARHAPEQVVPPGLGRLRGARGDHHGGGLDRQRGRPTAVDRLREDEGRGRRHRQHRDLDHVHRRGAAVRRPRRHHDPRAAADEPPVPGGRPRRRGRRAVRAERARTHRASEDDEKVPVLMATTAAVILFAAVIAYAVFGGADFGAGFWDLVAGRHQARASGLARSSTTPSLPVWEANHVWLIFVFVVLWTCFPEAYASITLTLFVPLTLAALGIVLRGASFAFRKAVFRDPGPPQLRRSVRDLVGAGALLLRCRGRRHRLGAGPGRGQGGRPVGQLGQPDVRARRACWRCAWTPTWPRSSWSATPTGSPTRRWSPTSAAGPPSRRSPPAWWPRSGSSCCSDDAEYLFDGLTSRALPLVVLSAVCGLAALVLVARGIRRGARLAAVGAVASVVLAWGVAQWDYLLPESLTVSAAAAPSGTITAVLVATGLAVVLIVPAFVLLYVLDQKSLLPEEGMPEPVPGRTT